jgi:hypothetical protein
VGLLAQVEPLVSRELRELLVAPASLVQVAHREQLAFVVLLVFKEQADQRALVAQVELQVLQVFKVRPVLRVAPEFPELREQAALQAFREQAELLDLPE